MIYPYQISKAYETERCNNIQQVGGKNEGISYNIHGDG